MRLTKVGQNGVEVLQVVAMGFNKVCQIPQSEIVCGKTKSNYTKSSDEYASNDYVCFREYCVTE